MLSRVAFWTPLPPQSSGIADYSFALLGELAKSHRDITFLAVVEDGMEQKVHAPPGIEVVAAARTRTMHCDLHIYQFGNHALYHGFMYRHALDVPGLLVLHDPSLVDFYIPLCGGEKSPVFIEEARWNVPGMGMELPSIVVDGKVHLDRMHLMMSRRLVDASFLTIVHNRASETELKRRFEGVRVETVHHPAKVLERNVVRDGENFTFGVLGGLAKHKRVPRVIEGFAKVHSHFPSARLLVAGRSDDSAVVEEVSELICSLGLENVVSLHLDVDEEELESLLVSCDVVVSLRWPTAGETSGILIRSLGAGASVIASDVPQNHDYDSQFCRLISHDEGCETEELLAAMTDAISHREAVAAAGVAAQRFIASEASFAAVANTYRRFIDLCTEQAKPDSALERGAQDSADSEATTRQVRPMADFLQPQFTTTPTVNAIGCWDGTTGLAEAARRHVAALVGAKVGVALEYRMIGIPRDPNRLPPAFKSLPKGRPASTDLFFLNINEMDGINDSYLRPSPSSYAIAIWYWELPDIPEEIAGQAARFDEIWVASRFVRDSLMFRTKAEIMVVPAVVDLKLGRPMARADFALPDDACIFFASFDANSTLARKNPWSTIEAFERAFPNSLSNDKVHLVVKTMNLQTLPEANAELRLRLRRVGATLIDEELSHDEVNQLTALCDVYVSLHRTEGFGLGMAEAMSLDKPVIATGYSGNMDFMDHSNSCLVGYELREITEAELRYNPGAERLYKPGMQWAEPNVLQAANWMQILAGNPKLRSVVGQRGAATIAERYSSEAAGRQMLSRLEALRLPA